MVITEGGSKGDATNLKVKKLIKTLSLEGTLGLTNLTIFDILAMKEHPMRIGAALDTSSLRKIGEVVVGTYSNSRTVHQDNAVNVFIRNVYDSRGALIRRYNGKYADLKAEELNNIGGWLGARLGGTHPGDWIGFIKREEPVSNKNYVDR